MKTLLVAVGLYAASLVTWLVLLSIGAIAAGTSHRGAAVAMLSILGLQALLFIAAGVAVVRRMKGAAGGARLGAALGWAALSTVTLVVMFIITAVVFDR